MAAAIDLAHDSNPSLKVFAIHRSCSSRCALQSSPLSIGRAQMRWRNALPLRVNRLPRGHQRACGFVAHHSRNRISNSSPKSSDARTSLPMNCSFSTTTAVGSSPGVWYVCYKYYSPQSHHPWMALHHPADASALAQLRNHKILWLIGRQPEIDGPTVASGLGAPGSLAHQCSALRLSHTEKNVKRPIATPSSRTLFCVPPFATLYADVSSSGRPVRNSPFRLPLRRRHNHHTPAAGHHPRTHRLDRSADALLHRHRRSHQPGNPSESLPRRLRLGASDAPLGCRPHARQSDRPAAATGWRSPSTAIFFSCKRIISGSWATNCPTSRETGPRSAAGR